MSRLTATSFFWNSENNSATNGTMTTTIAASFALMLNMTTMAPTR